MGINVREKVKGSGVWWIFIEHNGKRKSKRIGPKATAEAIAKKARERLLLNDLRIADREAPGFVQYAENWLESYIKPPMREPGTYRRYKGLIDNHIKKAFPGRLLADITRGDIRDFLALEYQNGGSRSSISTMQTVISGIFNHALDDEIISANPCNGVMRLLNLSRKQETEIEPFTLEESLEILETVKNSFPGYYLFFLILFRTGMRLGEACGLQWGDINFEDGFIKVQRTASHQRIKNGTKTNRSRKVDMTTDLASQLLKAYQAHKEERLKGNNSPWLFMKAGKLFYHTTARRIFKTALAKTGLDERRIHDIRHTYASLLLSNNAPILYVSNQLGHSSVKMTLDIYSHWIPSADSAAHLNFLDGKGKGANKVLIGCG